MKTVVTLCTALAGLAASAPALAAGAPDLSAMSLEQLLDVGVVGASKYEQKQSDVAAAVSVITRGEIKAFGWRTLDAALASLPGVYATYDRQYAYLGMRGFSVPGDFNTRVLLTINGNRVNDAVYDQAYAGRDFPIDMDLVERIEFIPGPGGAVYGPNAMLGVVNVVTRNGVSLGGVEADAAVGTRLRQREGRLSWGRRLDNGVDVLLSASGMRARGEDRFMSYGDSGIQGRASGLDGERDGELFARVAGGHWSAEVVWGNRRKSDPTGVYRSDPLVPGTAQNDRMLLAQVEYQGTLGSDGPQLSARAFGGQERYRAPETFDGNRIVSGASSDWHGLELRLLATHWPGHKLMVGAEVQVNRRQDQSLDDLDTTPDVLDVLVARKGWRTGLYVQDEWMLGPRLHATLGVRSDRNNTTGTSLSPRVGLIVKATPATTLKALYGRAHRAPNVFERDFTDGYTSLANAALDVESVDTLEGVVDHRVGADLALRASAFRWVMRGQITNAVDAATGLPQFQNTGDIRAQGVEMSMDRTWHSGARLRTSLTAQRAMPVGAGEMPNSPRLLGRLNLSGPLPWAGLVGALEWRHDTARQTFAGTRLGGASRVNLQFNLPLAPGLDLGLGVDNLLDRSVWHPASPGSWQQGFEQDGRRIGLRLSWRP